MALSERVENWIEAEATAVYERWCNDSLNGGVGKALADGLRAAYLRGRADERDGFRADGDPLAALEAKVTRPYGDGPDLTDGVPPLVGD